MHAVVVGLDLTSIRNRLFIADRPFRWRPCLRRALVCGAIGSCLQIGSTLNSCLCSSINAIIVSLGEPLRREKTRRTPQDRVRSVQPPHLTLEPDSLADSSVVVPGFRSPSTSARCTQPRNVSSLMPSCCAIRAHAPRASLCYRASNTACSFNSGGYFFITGTTPNLSGDQGPPPNQERDSSPTSFKPIVCKTPRFIQGTSSDRFAFTRSVQPGGKQSLPGLPER